MLESVEKFEIPGLLLITPKVFTDERGYFLEAFKESDYAALNLPKFVQDNVSVSKKGVLRGLHYQLSPSIQGKLIRVLKGEIFDVVVDLRKKSPAFKQYRAFNLNSSNAKSLYVPEGCAHGFLSLAEDTLVFYKTTSEYSPLAERGILWKDKNLNINWPYENPIVIAKDQLFPILEEAEYFE